MDCQLLSSSLSFVQSKADQGVFAKHLYQGVLETSSDKNESTLRATLIKVFGVYKSCVARRTLICSKYSDAVSTLMGIITHYSFETLSQYDKHNTI